MMYQWPPHRPARLNMCAGWWLLLLALGWLPAAAYSQPNSLIISNVELPAQPLNQALNQLARQWQVAIAFNPEQLAGLKSPIVKGEYSPAGLLEKLLKHSGYQAKQQGSG